MNPETLSSWQVWAVLSAVFAALTAIFAKVGVEDINPDLATFIRTIIVLISFCADPVCYRPVQPSRADLAEELDLPGAFRARHRRVVAVLFSRAEAWPGDAGGADRQTERRAGGAVRVIFLGERPSLNGWLGIALIAAGAVLIVIKR